MVLVLCQACTNNIELYVNSDPTPVVYCLLNPLEDTQYVRVGRSFNLPSGESDKAISPDSLSWSTEPEVYIEEWEDDDPVRLIIFKRSDITRRDSGLFPVSGLDVYRAEFKPVPGKEYHLFVYFEGLDKIVSAETIVMSAPEVLDPYNVPGRTISFDTISPYYLRWSGGDYPGLYQGLFKMNYSETINDNTVYESCYFKTPVYRKQSVSEIFEERVNGLNFLKSVADQLDDAPGIKREVINFEFIFYSTGSDLSILVGGDLNEGNPFSIIRNSSNIYGGSGVFSSMVIQKVTNLEASLTTKYFLATSQLTKDLGFIYEGQ